MRWFYDVKKRKTIIGFFVFSLFVVIILFFSNFYNRGNELKVAADSTVKVTNAPGSTIESEITTMPMALATITPTAALTLSPTITTTATINIPTATTTMATNTTTAIPIETPTATTTPTIAVPTITPTVKPLPTPTPTVTLKATPKKTEEIKTKAPVKPPEKPSVKPVVEPTKAEPNIELRYKNGKANTDTDAIYPMFMVINNGNQNIKLSDIKIRYYYTKDKSQSETFWCDSFTNGSTNVIGHFVTLNNKKNNADSYLEISFSEAAGEVRAGSSVELSVGFAKNDWSQYNQKNDYSYSSSRSFILWNRVTLYLNGKLVFGTEP